MSFQGSKKLKEGNQAMLPFEFGETKENLSNLGGFTLIGKLLDNSEALKKFDDVFPIDTNRRGIPSSDIIRSFIGLGCLGERSYAAINLYKEDTIFHNLVENHNISEETIRQRLDKMGENEQFNQLADNLTIEILRKVKFNKIDSGNYKYYTLDIDVTPMNNEKCKKEGVGYTYKKFVGFAPIMAYLNNFAICFELRPGTQHSEKGAIQFLDRCLNIIKSIGINTENLLVRVDSGHDDKKFVEACEKNNLKYIIKRNLRQNIKLNIYQDVFTDPSRIKRIENHIYHYSRIEKIELELTKKNKLETRTLFDIYMTIDDKKKGELPGFTTVCKYNVDAWYTNLKDRNSVIIDLYHKHATSEQFHSELKTDMNIEKLPSKYFETNSAFLNIMTISFNIIRFIGDMYHKSFKKDEKSVLDVDRFRFKTVIKNIFFAPCKIIKHAGKTIIKFYDKSLYCNLFNFIAENI